MGTISFPILETLVVKEVSTVLVRIAAPQLRKLTIYAVSLNMTQATAGGVSFREPLDIALRVAVIRFILHHAPSLETLELYEPIARRRGSLPVDGPGSKAPQVDFGTWADSATFPRLSSVSLSPGDKLPNFMHTPVIRQLEIRSVAHRWIPSHNPYTQFSTAESLILHSAEKLNRTEAELDALGEVQHLKICLDPDAGLMLDELFFLRELIDERGVQPDEPSTSTSTSSAHKSVPLFPKLRSIHLHFSLWGDRNGWLFPGLQYYHSDPRNDPDEDEDNPNDTGSLWADEMSTEYDTAEYYSNSSQWESSGESNAEDEEGELVEGEEALAADASAEQMTSLPVDQPAEDIHEPSAAEPSSDHDVEPQAMATGEDGYDDDEDPAWAAACSSSALDTSMTLSDARSDPSLLGIHGEWYYPTSERDARRIYGHVLAVLKDVVSSRASTNGVGPLRQLRITISPRVVGDFTVPGELQEWFRSHLDTFEA
ncbi:hypothetical protein DL93DRAFT_2082836 [Clavulina sp. PMI_390]|nr:hypothetical protein DL93DRAFT_2082836 [Clavulina sp. PMI_390]